MILIDRDFVNSYFDNCVDDVNKQDKFFSTYFSHIWLNYLNKREYFAAERVWDDVLRWVYEWENNNEKTIHKGTPYYFWAVTCILSGNLEKGFLLMHQALEEDKRTLSTESHSKPAYYFVTLYDQKSEQFFKPKLQVITWFIERRIEIYCSQREGSLNFENFRSKFLTKPDLQDVVFMFVFESFHLYELLNGIEKKLIQNIFGSLWLTKTILSLCVIIDNLIKIKNSNKGSFKHQIDFLAKSTGMKLDSEKSGKVNYDFNNDFNDTLDKLLKSRYRINNNYNPKSIEEDLLITYSFRNLGAHEIKDQQVINKNIDEICQRVLNILFYTIEKLY